ncbi:MAG: hypothetical protein ACR2RL_20820, partial [Gammaproteobacteria bacterium]
VLICQRSQYVDFLVANDFHLHQACPVLGPEHYPRTLFPGLMERLRQQDNPSVYVLHDLTPAGRALTRKVREAPEWFGNYPDAKVINIGLVPALHDEIGPERPLAEIPGAGSGTVGGKIARGSGIELTAVRPRTFMRGLEQSLVAGAPLALLAEEKGKTGNRDSE